MGAIEWARRLLDGPHPNPPPEGEGEDGASFARVNVGLVPSAADRVTPHPHQRDSRAVVFAPRFSDLSRMGRLNPPQAVKTAKAKPRHGHQSRPRRA